MTQTDTNRWSKSIDKYKLVLYTFIKVRIVKVSLKKVKYTKGQIESQISDAVSKFEKEYMGRGPKNIKTKIFQNHILIIIDGYLTQSEQKLGVSENGIKLIKDMRIVLFEDSRNYLKELITDIIHVNIISMHADVSTKTGEKVIVVTLEDDIDDDN